jgi:hypothetical protein
MDDISASSGDDVVTESVACPNSTGEIDGDSTAGKSIRRGCSGVLSGFATASPSAASFGLRFSMAIRPRLVVHQSVTTFGYQLVTDRLSVGAPHIYQVPTSQPA